jgi:hypothetical protein
MRGTAPGTKEIIMGVAVVIITLVTKEAGGCS